MSKIILSILMVVGLASVAHATLINRASDTDHLATAELTAGMDANKREAAAPDGSALYRNLAPAAGLGLDGLSATGSAPQPDHSQGALLRRGSTLHGWELANTAQTSRTGRDGDVRIVVAEPGTLAILGLGLIALGAVSRRGRDRD